MSNRYTKAALLLAGSIACAMLVTTTEVAAAQGRNLIDPGRVFRGPKNKTRDVAGTPTSISVTPMFGWSDGSQTYSGQFKWADESLSRGAALYLSGSLGSQHFSGTSRMMTQFDGEYDYPLNDKFTLVGSAELWHMADIGNNTMLAPELDIAVNDNVTVAPIIYWNNFKPSGFSTSSSSTTYGVFAVLRHDDWKFIPEYDPNMGDAFEDTFSLKAMYHMPGQKYKPWLFGTMQKHNVFSIGTILTLK